MVTTSLSKPHTSYKKQLTNKKSYIELKKQKQELLAQKAQFRKNKGPRHSNPNKVPLGAKENENEDEDEEDLDYDDSVNSLSFVLKKLKADIKATKRALKQVCIKKEVIISILLLIKPFHSTSISPSPISQHPTH
jgi:hypothetical protein